MNKHNFTKYEKAINFLKNSCNCSCSNKILKEKFAEVREDFQALSKSEQDIFLMAQLKAMNGGEITASRHLKKKTRTNKRFTTEIAIRHLVRIPRVHGNVKRVPR